MKVQTIGWKVEDAEEDVAVTICEGDDDLWIIGDSSGDKTEWTSTELELLAILLRKWEERDA